MGEKNPVAVKRMAYLERSTHDRGFSKREAYCSRSSDVRKDRKMDRRSLKRRSLGPLPNQHVRLFGQLAEMVDDVAAPRYPLLHDFL